MDKIKNLGVRIMEKWNILIERAKTDKKFLCVLAGILLAVILVIVAIVVFACGNGNGQGIGGGIGHANNGEKVTYTVSVKSQGGMALSEIDVAIYGDEKHRDLYDYATTDENGLVNFQLGKEGK